MRTLLAAVCCALALQGCASTGPNRTTIAAQALQAGNYSTAESYAQAAIQAGERPDINWHNLGLLYRIQAGQSTVTQAAMLQRSQSAFAMAARYGTGPASSVLYPPSQPQPVARSGDGAAVLASLLLVGAGAAIAARNNAVQPPMQFVPAPSTVNCTSMLTGTILHTDCR